MENGIRWINLHKDGGAINPRNQIYQNLNYFLPKDLFFIDKLQNYCLVYSPLVMRLYIIPEDCFISLTPISFKKKYLEALIQSSVLLPEQLKNIYLPKECESFHPRNIRLLVTSKCNLSCVYCYASAGSKGRTIDLKKVRLLFAGLPEGLNPDIELHGNGEPTLAIKEIKEIVKIIRNKYKDAVITIQSNGLFPEKTAKWFVQNNIGVGFSIDGPEFIHNQHRPAGKIKNPYQKLLKNIEYLHSQGNGVFAYVVVSAFSFPYLTQIYEHLKTLGFRYLKINPLQNIGRAATNIIPAAKAPDLFEFAGQLAELQIKAVQDNILLDSDFVPAFQQKKASPYRCNGCMSQLVMDWDGKILACSEAHDLAEPPINPFYFGEVNNTGLQLDEAKSANLRNRTSENIKECVDCLLKWHCSGSCMVENYLNNQDIYLPCAENCQARRHYAISYMKQLASDYLNKL